MENRRYDAVVVGAGRGGVPLAMALAGAGWRTALVERGPIGGTCTNVGCAPSKAIWASARVARMVTRASEYGVLAGPATADLVRIVERKNEVIARFQEQQRRQILGQEHLDMVRGEARLVSPGVMEVLLDDDEPRVLETERVFLDTGSRPRVPRLLGLDAQPYLDSSSIMDLEVLPEHLLVLGGGFVGLEFAQMFRRLGSQVTVIESGRRILSWEDPDIAAEVRRFLEDEGVEVVTGAQARQVVAGRGGTVGVQVADDPGEHTWYGSHLLVAVGRAPNSDGIGLEQLGVVTDDQGYVVVNGRLETSAPGIWALGDVSNSRMFANTAYDDYRIIKTNLLGGGNASRDGRPDGYGLFTDPPLGRVGLSESEAHRLGLSFRVARIEMSMVPRAVEGGEQGGFVKVLLDDGGRILGAAALCAEGAEVAAVLRLAMTSGLTTAALRDSMFIHPSLAEVLNQLPPA